MHIEPWANAALVFFVVLFGVIAVGALVALAVVVTKLSKLVETLAEKADPVIAKASTTLDSVQRVTVTVGEKADMILSRGETLTENVADKVEKTTTVVQNAVTKPLINFSSLIAGVSKGVSTWSAAEKNGGPKHPRDGSKE